MSEWLLFIFLSAVWGTSFLWIKIALSEMHPDLLVALRLTLGFLSLLIFVIYKKEPFPRGWKVWARITAFSALSPVLPFFLIAWAETQLPSSVAALLNGTVPFFSFICAHFLIKSERMESKRVVSGIVVGFLGLLCFYGKDAAASLFSGQGILFWAKFAMTLASLFYALGSIGVKIAFKDVPRMQLTSSTLLTGAILSWIKVFISHGVPTLPQNAMSWVAVCWLGILGTGVCWTLYVVLLARWGVTKSNLVTYTFPVVGFFAGTFFLGETANWTLLWGVPLILLSLLLLNWPKKKRLSPASRLV